MIVIAWAGSKPLSFKRTFNSFGDNDPYRPWICATKPTLTTGLHSDDAMLRSILSFGTMDINALVISGSDPGAVPGVSTTYGSFDQLGDEIGSTNV